MVNGQIVGNPQNPGEKLALFSVFARFEGVDHLDEGVLKQVVRHVLVAHDEQDFREHLFLVPVHEGFESPFVALDVEADQLLVAASCTHDCTLLR